MDVSEDRLYKTALTFVKGVSADVVRRMEDCGVSPRDFFSLGMQELAEALGGGRSLRFENLGRQEAIAKARNEIQFMERHNIYGLSLLDENYPVLLREIPDAPVMLFIIGNADFDSRHIINMVGTRKATPYGISFCGSFVKELGEYFPDLLVVSGLAYGIDAASHEAALSNGTATMGVVAHGLDTIYPAAHRDLARRIIASGGSIVTEYPSHTPSHRNHFLARNRIIAGLSEVTVVVESEIKGGAMSTANCAFSYNREVMALPGRITDIKSGGCNMLIHRQKAHILTSAADVIEHTGWRPLEIKVNAIERNLFPELEGDSAKVYNCLRASEGPESPDVIQMQTGLSIGAIIAALTELEFDGIVVKFPGNRYEVV